MFSLLANCLLVSCEDLLQREDIGVKSFFLCLWFVVSPEFLEFSPFSPKCTVADAV